MGSDRSISKLRKKLMLPKCLQNVTKNVPCLMTLKRWSKAFNWQEKVKQLDSRVNKIVNEKIEETAVYSKADYRKLVKEVADKFKEKLKEGKIKISKPQDIIEIIKLDLLMMGEVTGREEVTHKLIDVNMNKYPEQK